MHGELLLAACANEGTDSFDWCREPGWIAQLIARYVDTRRGVRLIRGSIRPSR
jgi:short subunit dehydrogenase-like uncharacterized protein